MNILMVAAENGALPGGKVGGIGDVIRDLPRVLASRGHEVTVVMPGYGHFSRLPNASDLGSMGLEFGGREETVSWHQARPPVPSLGVNHRIIEHPVFAVAGAGNIYYHDVPSRPFAMDATKFALFCLAIAEGLQRGHLSRPDVLHLHDWHAALLALLCRRDGRFAALSDIPLVYTIHNLSLQGIRPLDGDESSLATWFPGLDFPAEDIVDPRYDDCINPTRVALRLCDRIHAVSPTYAREIIMASDPGRGFVGGEGLEVDLARAQDQGRLVGILNGVNYPETSQPRLPLPALLEQAESVVNGWLDKGKKRCHRIAAKRLQEWQATSTDDGILITSIGRMTPQKLSLLLQPMKDKRPALDHLLDVLGDRGKLILLGSGDPVMEEDFTDVAQRRDNLLFLRGYAEELGELLYSSGDLFLMPSSFEPCGISQMLAMRSGQPCLVHGVGGLLDTVEDGVTGFVFRGKSPRKQAKRMVKRFEETVALWEADQDDWERYRQRAAEQRFTWDASVRQMERQLYTFD